MQSKTEQRESSAIIMRMCKVKVAKQPWPWRVDAHLCRNNISAAGGGPRPVRRRECRREVNENTVKRDDRYRIAETMTLTIASISGDGTESAWHFDTAGQVEVDVWRDKTVLAGSIRLI